MKFQFRPETLCNKMSFYRADLASHADILLARHVISPPRWGGVRDEPKECQKIVVPQDNNPYYQVLLIIKLFSTPL